MLTGFEVFLSIALAIDASLLVFSLTRQERRKSLCFTILTGALGIYTAGYLLEIMSKTSEAAMTALKIENVGIPLIGPFFLLLMISLFHLKRLKNWMVFGALLYGFIIFQFVLHNETHHLYYSAMQMETYQGIFFAELEHGPLYFLQQLISISCVACGFVIVLRRFATGGAKLQRQIGWILAGAAVALGANIVYLTGLLSGFDPTPFALTVAMICFAINMIRFNLLDIVPVASFNAIEMMEDGLIVLDKDYCFQFANQSARRLFPEIGEYVRADDVSIKQNWPPELSLSLKPGEIKFERKEAAGAVQYYRASISAVNNRRGGLIGWSYIIRNVTDITVMINQMEVLATTDPLTGIYNRRQFYARVKQEMDWARRYSTDLSLILFDIDYFKAINDTYGHSVGDQVLCSIVDAVKKMLRPYDIFARYGGEEFVIFIASPHVLDLYAFTDRIRKAVDEIRLEHNGKQINVTASFGGVKVSPNESIDHAFAIVDDALYKAKSGGRNKVVIIKIEADENPEN